jgi:hypothetical protein
MLIRNRRSVSVLAGMTLVALLALPAVVLGNTSGPIAQTGGMTATLPLFGSPLKVAVTLDVVGNISAVDIDPIGDFSATRVGPHAVSFETTDGAVQVKIKAKGDKMSIRASASSLADLVGSGTWSADVFGTGDLSEVAYTVGAALDGTPTLAIDSVAAAPSGVVVDAMPVENKTDEKGSSASARIEFSFEGFVKHLKIKVSVRHEGDRVARLSFELSGKDRQKLSGTLEELVGAHSWTGFLCDGTPATVNFMVNLDGTVSFVDATPAATRTDTAHGFKARFDGTRTKVKVKLAQNEDGTWTLKGDAKTDRCKDTPAASPIVNTPVLSGDEDSDHHGDSDHHEGGDRSDGGSGDH